MAGSFYSQLRKGLIESCSIDELRDLCLDLDVDHENLHQATKRELARDLIADMRHKRRLPDLIAQLRLDKPETPWPEPPSWELFAWPLNLGPGPWLLIALVVLAVVLVVALVWRLGQDEPIVSAPTQTATTDISPLPIQPVAITQPADGEVVGHEVHLVGELAAPVCEACDLYVIVHPVRSGEKYYVQTNAAVQRSAQAFAVENVTIGRPSGDDNGRQFELWVVLAPSKPASIMTADEWAGFVTEDAASVVVTREGLLE